MDPLNPLGMFSFLSSFCLAGICKKCNEKRKGNSCSINIQTTFDGAEHKGVVQNEWFQHELVDHQESGFVAWIILVSQQTGRSPKLKNDISTSVPLCFARVILGENVQWKTLVAGHGCFTSIMKLLVKVLHDV